jgi:ABC transport system ATP-binding/permease protein
MKIRFVANGETLKEIQFSPEEKKELTIGNGNGVPVDIVLPFATLSRKHATLFVDPNGLVEISDNNSTNGTYLNKGRLQPQQKYPLHANDVINFASPEIQAIVESAVEDKKPEHIESVPQNEQPKSVEASTRQSDLAEEAPSTPQNQLPQQINSTGQTGHGTSTKASSGESNYSSPPKSISEALARQDHIIIGRDKSCDLVLESSSVSRRHAEAFKKDNVYTINDLGSTNGTYVNGVKITSTRRLEPSDVILIGTTKLSINELATDIRNEVAIKLINVEKVFPDKRIGLHKINLSIRANSLVGIMGPSGCGKSTLLKAITGDNPPSSGNILIHGLDLLTHYEYIKTYIGYVPQDDIIHKDLTVQQCLYYSAKLRIEHAETDYVNARIEKVLQQLNIPQTRHQLISKLSGGQRKRVSIAVELLNDPFILFLDEPTSPLDPQSVEEFLIILKNLAEQGTTVVLVTHKPEDLLFLDEVLFLGKDGYPVFFDKVSKHLDYFHVTKTVSIYPKLSNPADPEFQAYYQLFTSTHPPTDKEEVSTGKISAKKTFGFARQLHWLTRRYITIKTNDKFNTAILLFQAPAIALLVCLIFNKINLGLLFMMAISAVWFGTNNAAREIVSEAAIYKRERMYNLNLMTYLSSKIIVLSLLAFIQSFVYVSIVSVYFSDASVPLESFLSTAIWFWIVTVVASVFGLFLSALCKTVDQVSSLIPMALIPQIMLAGVLAKISTLPIEFLSYFTISRWASEGFSNIQSKLLMSMPQPDIDGISMRMVDAKVNSNTALLKQFHDKYSNESFFGDLTGTMVLDITFLLLLTGTLLWLTIRLLKKKDSINQT